MSIVVSGIDCCDAEMSSERTKVSSGGIEAEGIVACIGVVDIKESCAIDVESTGDGRASSIGASGDGDGSIFAFDIEFSGVIEASGCAEGFFVERERC